MNTTRTDVHAPSSPDFDPQAYNCYGVFDFTPEFDGMEVQARIELVNEMIGQGYRFGGSQTGGCGHCGTRIRYGALMARDDVMEMIWVGETCLDGRFELEKDEFQKLRKASQLNRERMARTERIDALCTEYPILAELTYGGNGGLFDADWSEFLANMQYALVWRGEMSDRQIAAAVKCLTKAVEFLDRKAAREAQRATDTADATPVPTGKGVTITGTVVKVDWQDNAYGGREVMTVKNEAGWLVWGSVPKSLNTDAQGFLTVNSGVKVGDMVTFTATVEASDRPEFGFFKRPTKARKVA